MKLRTGERLRGDEGVRLERLVAATIPSPFAATRRSSGGPAQHRVAAHRLAPMLVLGAQFGLLFGILCQMTFPELDVEPVTFAVVGMAAFFTGVVRAPATGMVLVIEMTGSFTMLLPMLAACFTAMLVPTLLGNPSIYDSLRHGFLSVKADSSAISDIVSFRGSST
jgi:hypothetical protein